MKSPDHLTPLCCRTIFRLLAVLVYLFGGTFLWANIPGGGTGTGANVTLTSTSTTATMSNGVVSIVCTKSSGQITAINYTFNNTGTSQTLNLLSGNPNGGKLYWETGTNQGLSFTYALVTDPASNGGNYAEIAVTTTSETNSVLEVHYSMLRGSPGFYVTAIWSHRAVDGAWGLGECRNNIYAGGIFNWMSVDATRNRLMQVSGGKSTGVPTAPVECTLWTNGLYQGQYEDKYKYSAPFGTQRVWGWSSVNTTTPAFTGKNVGLWDVSASAEYYNGGPLKQELMCHIGTTILNMFNGGHYDMGTDGSFTSGEVWGKVCGPYLVYCNNVPKTITDPVQASQALYNDALAQGAAEATAWPYSWFINPGYAPASNRGTVTGKMVIADTYHPNASAAKMWVGVVRQPVTSTGNYDFQQWAKPYQFWIQTDSEGNFSIPDVIAGSNYTLYAFGPGAAGTFMSQAQSGGNPPLLYNIPASPFSVTVNGGATTALGNVTWTPTRVGPSVFEIGYPDRTSRKYRHGDDWWVGDIGPSPTAPSPVWTKFLEYPFDFPSGLNYTVGGSRWSTDWNFVQPVVQDGAGNWNTSTSTITFNLAAAPTAGTQASLYIAQSSNYAGPMIARVNGTNLGTASGATSTPSGNSVNGYFASYGDSDTTVREGINAAFSDERITFPGTLLKAGSNTITLNMRKGGYFANHAMYDYVRLELAGYIPAAPSGVIGYAGNNSNLVVWPVAPGATGYNILRSTTSGGGYASVASGVVGPVSGSGPANATWLDTTALNNTTYYYVVQSVNPVGASANSAPSFGVTPLATLPVVPPAAPTGLVATPGNGSVALSWAATSGANYYTLQRSSVVANGGGTFNNLGTITLNNNITGTTFTDTTPTNGSLYRYTVSASNAAGTGAPTSTANAKPVAVAPTTPPTGVTATPGVQLVALTWSAVPGTTGYVIQSATTSGGPYTYLASVSALKYTDGGQADNTKYYYVITASNSGGVSANSAEVSSTTAPVAPTGFTATAGNLKVTLNWTAPPGATSYVVSRSTTLGGPYTVIAASVGGTSYVDLGLTSGTPYYYIIAANGIGTTGPNSVEVTATPFGVTSLTWTGATSTAWDTTTSNWLNGTTASVYTDTSEVLFDDTATNTTVVITPDVSPNDILFNNITKGYTVSGAAIAGATTLSKTGAGTLTISGANTYTGGSEIAAGSIVIGGPLSNAQNGLGTGPITFLGGTLTMNGHTGSTGSTYGVLANPLNIPGGSTGTLKFTQRGGQSGPVTGNGTLALQVNYLRGDISGDWSGFTGQINVTRTSTGTSSDKFRINSTTGFGIAAIDLGPYVQASTPLNATNSFTIGELSGDATAQLSGIIYNNATPGTFVATYLIGGRHTNTTFAGTITNGPTPGKTSITKEGTGTWTLTGASTYTGTTTVTGGTLSLLGSITSTGSTAEIGNTATFNLSGGTLTMATVHIATGGTFTGCGTLNAALVNDGTVSCGCGSPGKLIVNGAITNNGFMQFTAGTGLQNSGTFTNNGTLDLITGIQSLPANFTNHGIVLDSSSVRVLQVFSSGADMQLVINSVAGHTYQLQRRDSLTTGTWLHLGAAVPGNNAALTLTDTDAANDPQGFYRILVSP